ncbi:dihydroxyacetone kinase subunit DhaL [Methylobacterium oryzisoli]|uniref:dihydroxyacetone kinase subunit DhaL n=1 Tax=Methylobacterium oryzisoli TaxID=3385502 RepID=UPI0038929966
MTTPLHHAVIAAMARTIVDHADELTLLDQAIGDGDHGLNMRRGFEAVLADLDGLAAKPLPDALKSVGTTLVMRVGGASGPLFGTLFMTLARDLPAEPTLDEVASALDKAVAAVQARGKSEPGQKTMLDVLVPVQRTLAAGGADLARRLPAAAEEAARATVPMRAIRGRASFLGARSVGHMDPGARSAALLVTAACRVLEGVEA